MKTKQYKVIYKCPECGYKWQTIAPNLEIICPKCGELGNWDKSIEPKEYDDDYKSNKEYAR